MESESAPYCLTATDAKEFARNVVAVLKDPAQYRVIAENGFRLVRDRYSAEAAGAVYKGYLEELISGPH